eukprot:tig00020909_g15354.t1
MASAGSDTKPAKPYRQCAGAVLFNSSGQLLAGERFVIPNTNQKPDSWQFPQGGVDPGEDPEAAAAREAVEELGILPSSLTRIAALNRPIRYEFDPAFESPITRKFCGQELTWVLFQWDGKVEECDLNAHIEPSDHGGWPEFAQVRFVDWPFVLSKISPMKRAMYEQLRTEFEPIIAARTLKNK